MKVFYVSVLSIVTACSAFILDNTNPTAYITVKQFRELMDLVLEEKHFRRILQHNVGTMQQRAVNNKVAMDTLASNYHTLSTGYSQLISSHADMKNGSLDLRNRNQTIQSTLTNNSAALSELKHKSGMGL